MKHLAYIALLVLVSCKSNPPVIEPPVIDDCLKLRVKVDVQHEVIQAASLAEVQTTFADCWAHVVSRFSEINIDVELVGVTFWTVPDTFSTAGNSCTRVQENESGWTEEKEYIHLVLGRLWGKCWYQCWPRWTCYCVFALQSTGQSTDWNRYFWTHTIGHMAGAGHDVEECHMMNSYCPQTGIIPHNAAWSEQSRRDIWACLGEWCEYN